MSKIRITIPSDVTLPALTTNIPSRTYAFLSAVREWACYAPSMREEDKLEQYEELVEAIDAAAVAVGTESIILSEPCWTSAKAAFKQGVDAAMDARTLPTQYAPKILKMYYAFCKGDAVKE